jgi:cell division protein FtsI (penicillin-binding protein 3)
LLTTWLVAMLAACALIARLAMLQVAPSERLVDYGPKQWTKKIPLQATRGSIVDRNGADLAISVPQTTYSFDSRTVVDPAGDAAKLAPLLGKDPIEVQELLASGKGFVYLARQVDDATAAAVDALHLPYLVKTSEDKRFRPSGDGLALSVVGKTDAYLLNGISGLEKQYDTVLEGHPGEKVVEQGAGGRTIPGGEHELDPATPGSNLVLSLDRALQYEVEQMLLSAVDAANAKGGTVLVSRVSTGEILVDANVVRPEPDPAATGAEGESAPVAPTAQLTGENRAVTWTYEPGSVNKVITMAGVLEEGLATPETTQKVSSAVEVFGTRFAQEYRSTDEELSLRQILARSDNPGTIGWAQQLGQERLAGYLHRFGLGEPTGLDFPYESKGIVPDLRDWNGTSLPTFAIGQGLAVTPMQMLGVYNTIANGGTWVPPRLVLGSESPDGQFTANTSGEPHRVVSEATAAALRDMLTTVVDEGTGKKAQVEGFRVGGKTGTAWEPVGGSYGTPGHRHLATSFVGFLPASQPELSIMVVIDGPRDPYATGGTVAAPLFHDVATFAVRHLGIPPDVEAAPAAGDLARVRATPQAPPAPTTTAPPATTSAPTSTSTPTTVPTKSTRG